MRRALLALAAVLLPLLLALLAAILVLLPRQGGLAPFRVPAGGSTPADSDALVERGRHLAQLGNCIGCHTVRGGEPLAGGRAFKTRYGIVYSSNITPDPEHGIGAWSSEEFRHVMRHGISRNGVLSPVFPYANFRHLEDGELDALLAWLRRATPSTATRQAGDYRFPANLPWATTGWRLLNLRPAADAQWPDAQIARGARLVEGIGHCATCHASRGTFAAPLAGPQLWGARNAGWYAPALHGPALARFGEGAVARYLQGGAPHDIAGYGLMADVIAGNLRHLGDDDARAIEAYLRRLPPPPPVREPPLRVRASEESLAIGKRVYDGHCADCHGERGEGVAGKYPGLRGSGAIAGADPVNLVKLVMLGAVAPSTPLNPYPYTMPPFAHSLTAKEVAGVVNFLRAQDDRNALPVSEEDVGSMAGIE